MTFAKAKPIWAAIIAAAILSCVATLGWAQSVIDGFDPDVDKVVQAAASQSDGKLLIGGRFTQVDSQPRTLLARLNADGSVDSGFSVTITGIDITGIALQADGKILIAGQFTQVGTTAVKDLARLNANGSVDTSFAPTINAGFVYRAAVQTDGKIVIIGDFANVNSVPTASIARLNVDGSTDIGFIPPTLNVSTQLSSVLLQQDGRIVIGGQIAISSTSYDALRLFSNGTLDNSFQVTGISTDAVEALALQVDGKVLIGGTLTKVDGTTTGNVARVNTDGTIDASFTSPTVGDVDDEVFSLSLDATGNILVGGIFSKIGGLTRNGLARLGMDGTPDSFNAALGDTTSEVDIEAVIAQSDGVYFIAGNFGSVGTFARNNVARIGSGSVVDATLNLTVSDEVFTIAGESDGNMLIGGSFKSVGAATRGLLARIEPDGTVGSYNPSLGPSNGFVEGIAIEQDGSALIAGLFGTVGAVSQPNLAHLSSTGSLDTHFTPVINDKVYGLALQANGQIVIWGSFTTINGEPYPAGFARLNADGSPDSTFNVSANGTIEAVAALGDGHILIGGNFTMIGTTPVSSLARLNANGSVDTSFHSATADTEIKAFIVELNGDILVSTIGFTPTAGLPCSGVARLNADGGFVSCFSDVSNVDRFLELSDGKILMKGGFNNVADVSFGVARLNADGSLDSSFASIGPDNLGGITSMAVARDGKIVVGGLFSQMGGQNRSNLARISSPDIPQQSLSINANTVTWLRSGNGEIPALPPTLLYSTDFTTYAPVGTMTPIAGGWQYSGLHPVIGEPYALRVQAPSVNCGLLGTGMNQMQYAAEFYLSDDIFKNGFD